MDEFALEGVGNLAELSHDIGVSLHVGVREEQEVALEFTSEDLGGNLNSNAGLHATRLTQILLSNIVEQYC